MCGKKFGINHGHLHSGFIISASGMEDTSRVRRSDAESTVLERSIKAGISHPPSHQHPRLSETWRDPVSSMHPVFKLTEDNTLSPNDRSSHDLYIHAK